MDEYFLCASINGECKCQIVGARPCSSITELLESEISADDELERIESERVAAGTEEY